jgi:arylsulfatase A-like enzyme
MKLDQWLIAVGILILLHGTALCGSSLGADPLLGADQRPNVLMIVVDDMNDWVGCLGGHPQIRTPNIDRLAQRGILFANAHAPAPVCNPSRVSVLTGRSPVSTGIYGNDVVWHEAIPNITSLPGYFKSQGYRVIGGGKVNHHMPSFNRSSDWHEYFDQLFDSHYQDQLARGLDVSNFQWPEGFPLNGLEAVRTLSKPPKNPLEFDWGPWNRGDLDMGDGRMVAWAVDFLKQPQDQPFFLAAGIYRPHLPFYAPSKYFDQYPEDTIQMPIAKENDREDLPELGFKMAQDRGEDFELVVREGKHRELVRAYLANIAYADALVGHLLEALDASTHADNTIIVFWSDHGWHLGEKQHLHKFTLWERSTRVPLIVALPTPNRSKVSAQADARCTQPVGLVDIFPTLIDLCDLPAVDGLDGISLVPWIRNPDQERLQPAITTHGFGNHAIRSEHFRYILYSDGGEELYDHRSDPNEWHNLASDPAYAQCKQDLRAWIPKASAPKKRDKQRNRSEVP